MQSLLNGADCSTSSNPLNQVLKREGVDHSLFRDRQDAGPSRPRAAPQRPLASTPSTMQQAVPHPFNLSHLSAALTQAPLPHSTFTADFMRAGGGSPATASPPVTTARAMSPSFAPSISHAVSSDWAASYQGLANGKGKGREMPRSQPGLPMPQQSHNYAPFASMYSGMPTYQPRFQSYLPPVQQRSEVDERAHAEMEAAFEKALADARGRDRGAEAQTAAQTAPEAPAQHAPAAEGEREFKGELEAVWESLRPEAERLNQLARWEQDFSQFVNEEDDLFDILNDSLNREDVGQMPLDEQFDLGLASRAFEQDNGLPETIDYQFVAPNRFISHSPTAAWAEANRVLAGGGSLSDAALLLESFLQNATADDYAIKNVTDVHAWARLGRTHAEDEKEERALAAFEQGRKALNEASAAPVAGEMLTNLAISYVNESLDLAALTTLHQFLTLLHPAHAGAAPSRATAQADGASPWLLHEQMRDAFLGLARAQFAAGGAVDPDVQVGLGTLYYMTGDFAEARGCWVAALEERPNDYLLWNRLGATLANGGSPEDAVDAYRRALEIKPGFTRAIYNLGVACLNIGVHREAAEHFLSALALQSTQNGQGGEMSVGASQSFSVWSTLRRALTAMDLTALADQARPGADLAVFRQAGFEF